MKIYIRLGEILKERGLTQSWLVEKTGLRRAVVSEIVHNQRTTINKDHIQKICAALDIEKLEDFMGFKKDGE